ncbi:probable disease resistance protein At1g61190 [Neltuma alba]|uniref:probable disease resistance protein At1g61190 n=1 Tax=Neltuma alba TaxID=207710 RepID=UPI0010A4FE50|nr:probable disease resistance protein At1g61190 [Prosopis alba]
MEKLGDIMWDITKYLCGCAKQEAGLICKLEGNLQSLESKWKKLEAVKKDVEAQIEEVEGIREGQRTYEVSGWLQSIQNIQKEVEDNLYQGVQEIQNNCLSKCCPKNCKSSYKLGKNVAKMLTKVDDLTAEGQGFVKGYPITRKPSRKGIGQIPLEETVGQDLIFDKVWSRIEANNVGVIGLYGTGGVERPLY